jgi:hypothetical protein
MAVLCANVTNHCILIRRAYAEGGKAALPDKTFPHPSGRAGLNFLNSIRQRPRRRQLDQQVSVVVHPTDFVRQDILFAANASYKGPEFRSVIQRNKLATLLGAEHNMNKILYVRVGHFRSFLRLGCAAPNGALEY